MSADTLSIAAIWASKRRGARSAPDVLLDLAPVQAAPSSVQESSDWLTEYRARRQFEDTEELIRREPQRAYDGGDTSPFGVACSRTIYCALRGVSAPDEEPYAATPTEENSRRWADLTDDVELPTGRMGSLSEEERALLRDRVQRRDRRAAEALVKGNLGLVHKIARRYHRVSLFSDMPYEDMIQEGTLGLLQAAESWEPERAVFSTYASMWIKHALRRAIQD